MAKSLKIVIEGYLKKSYLGEQGAKDLTLSYSAKDAIEIAKIELMGRDLVNHLPVLLRTTYEISPERKESSRKAANIPNASGVTGKHRKVF